MNRGKIAEIFESIQGEGLYLGKRQLFVRFFGCNLTCKFCDTKLDYFTEYKPQELLRELKRYKNNFHSISFTGGEPLLQKDFLKEILKLAVDSGYRNYLETNGVLADALLEVIDYLDIVAMDLKLPSSTGLGHFWPAHQKFLKIASSKEVFLKAVICQLTKEEDLKEGLKIINEVNKSSVLVLQPNSDEDSLALRRKIESFKDICLKAGIIAYAIPQLQKQMGIR